MKIYTDWACSWNPWPWWRWGIIIKDKDIIKLAGKKSYTTNNQMEMQATVSSMIYICDNMLPNDVSQNISNIYKKYLEPSFFWETVNINQAKLDQKVEMTIYTDSKYVYEGINNYIQNRKRNGRRTTARQPVKNQELRQAIDFWNEIFEPKWVWVKWHASNKYNNLADKLATWQLQPDITM